MPVLCKYGYAPQMIVSEFIKTGALAVARSRYADFCRADSRVTLLFSRFSINEFNSQVYDSAAL